LPHNQGFKLRSGFRIILGQFFLFITTCFVHAHRFIGEHHVFRFNNPEEVRKQRDRAMARSSLHQSITAADIEGENNSVTRADSPTGSSVDLNDADWSFAKREHAFARLGLDPTLDNLPDEDLNKLFEKITKVKTMRDHISKPRPESSLSQADDVWSESGRPFSSDALTDDTSVDAGGTPNMDGSFKGVQNQLESQGAEFESRLQAIAESTEAEDLKAEKHQIEHQLKLIKTQMKRIIDARARGEEIDTEAFEPVIYSARQLKLIRKVLDKWRAHRSFSMAEVVLSSAVVVKEANVIR
jgi:kinesin family protein 1